MYVYTRADETLVFSDLFGLTRIRLAKKQVKTDRKEGGSFLFGTLSCDARDELLYTCRDTWNKATLWALPLLKSAQRFPRFERTEGVLHPDGSWVVFPKGFSLWFDFYKGAKDPTIVDLTPSTGEPPALPYLAVPAPLRFDRDGRFAFFCRGVLQEGVVDEDRVDVQSIRTLAIPASGLVELFLDREDTWVVHSQGGLSTIYGPRGEVETRTSITPPQIAGGKVIYQPDTTHMLCEDLATNELERFDLEKRDQGFAQILPGSKALFMLPWHREEVVDLRAGDRISRKLPKEERATREALMKEIQKLLQAAMLAGGFIDWAEFHVDAKFSSYSHTAHLSTPPTFAGSLFANLAYPFFRGKPMGGRTVGSHGALGGGSGPLEGTWPEEDAIALLERYKAIGLTKQEILPALSLLNVSSEKVPRSVFDWLDEAYSG